MHSISRQFARIFHSTLNSFLYHITHHVHLDGNPQPRCNHTMFAVPFHHSRAVLFICSIITLMHIIINFLQKQLINIFESNFFRNCYDKNKNGKTLHFYFIIFYLKSSYYTETNGYTLEID